jgi:peptide/nickel transport system substrate-binding protein
MKTKMLILSVVAILVLLISSCAQQTPTAPPQPTAVPATDTPVAIKAVESTETAVPTVEASKYKEAPALADMVKAGSLPAVDKRLPDTPLTTKPVESVGKYGGTIHTASWWPEAGNVQLYFAVEAPLKWKGDLTGYEAALVESYEWSTDGTAFTMHLRKGMKWSDGEPYTSADWKFYWEDYAKNPDQKLYTIPAYLRKSDGTPIDMEFPDDYTVVWKSDKGQWIAPYYMAQGYWEFAKNMMKPAHYLKQYHPKYATGKTWEDYVKIDKWWQTANYPCLFAWCNTEVSSDGNRYKFTRNPYYWRVDTEGNQLPYIDAIDVEIVSDEQTRILSCTQGKYDTAFRICGGPNEIPLLQQNGDAGNYHLLKGWMNGAGAWPGYMVNQWYVEGGKNYSDDTPEHAKEIRDVLRDTRFRKALSVGFDRQRIIDVAWNGIGTPKAATISPQAWHFASPEGQTVFKEWAATDATMNLDQANAWLDEVGMKVGADGFRTLPSGKAFAVRIDVTDWGGSLKVQTDAAAEMKVQWEKNLKLKVDINNIQGQPDVDTRTNEGYYMLRAAHISEIDIWTYPDWLFPVVNRYMFPLEGRYYAMGKDACKPDPNTHMNCGVKPEAGSPAEKLQAIYDKGQVEPDLQKRHQLVWDAVKVIETDGPFVIGVSGDQAMPIYVKNTMHNILEFGVVGPWAPSTPGNTIASQWWMDQ